MSLANSHALQRLRSLTCDSLARPLKLSVDVFRDWVETGDDRFKPPRIDFSTGKKRVFDVPKYHDRKRFRTLNKFSQRLKLHHRAAHGGVCRRSPMSSAKRHLGKRRIWTTDIRNCFPSVSREMFVGQILCLGVSSELADLIANAFLCRNRIPQGCPTSNMILNLFFWHLDFRMTEYCQKLGLCYTRMADDMVISGDDEEHGEKATEKLHGAISNIGLLVNESKWERMGRQGSPHYMLVHSLNVAKGRLELSIPQKLHAETVAERAIGSCRSMQFSSFTAAVSYRNQLHGWYYYTRQTHDSITSRLSDAIRDSDFHARRVLQRNGITVKNWNWWIYPYCYEVKQDWMNQIERTIVQNESRQEGQSVFSLEKSDVAHVIL